MKKVKYRKTKGKSIQRFAAAFMAAAIVLTGAAVPSVQADAAESEYEIYPAPHSIRYEGDSWIIKNEVNVVYEEGIDDATKQRLNEVFALKSDISVSESDKIAEGKTNVLVGIDGSEGYVDQYTDTNLSVSTPELFGKSDSYILDSREDVITVLGKDTDASFYGLTTLYHIMNQMDGQTIRSFHIEDWADVASRGFIEGYYGNPWSTQDRCNLMKWGGYYKLNSYFYAPKNDPKHNSQWRQLYTDDEIESLIKPLAAAGNTSKCRFVYALHTFMNSPVRFDSNYEADLAAVQAKFEQVIKAGVRQIAILADDAANVGGDNYVRFLKDMTAWLAGMKEQYPDLKQTLPFCTVEYMGNGEAYYNQFPENVQIVMTGGTVWGKVTDQFTTNFTSRAGRGPYLWINWPCTDNSKKHLIMGGYADFLHPGVNPEKIQGIVLNPMQQSEPSKVAIFGNACYSWNIWKDTQEADQAWNDSFKYVDHNSAVETDASGALRELSKHMINQNMPLSKVAPLQESVELEPKLTEFKTKLSADTVTAQDADDLIKEFEKLQNAADTYESQAGDTNVKDQIIYWLDCWHDTTDAAIAYLNGVKAVLDHDTTGILQYNAEGKTAFDSSKTHEFWYLDHNEYAEVGVQHIVPFITAMDSWLSTKVKEVADPTVVTQTYISNSFTRPASGSTDNVLDGNDSTSVQFKEPNYPKAGDYFGIRFNRAITVDILRVSMGGGKNHLQYSKFQYLPDGADEETGWQDVSGTEYTRGNGSAEVIQETGLGLRNVIAVRLIAARDNEFDSWVSIHSFDVNKEQTGAAYEVTEVTVENAAAVQQTNKANVTDGDKTSEFWLKSSGGDRIDENAAIILDLGQVKEIGSVYVAQDTARADGGDILGNGIVEYSTDKSDWKTFGDLQEINEQTVSGSVSARYIRVRNEETKAVWWRIGEISVFPPTGTEKFTMTASGADTMIGNNQAINDGAKNNKYEYITDGNPETLAWLAGKSNGNIGRNQGVEITFDREVAMKEITVMQGEKDKVSTLKVEYKSGSDWKELTTVQNAGEKVNVQANGTKAEAIRLTNGAGDTGYWWQLYEVSVSEMASADAESVYTDVEDAGFTAAVEAESAMLVPGEITLDAGQYIGIDMKEIRRLESIDAEYTEDGIQLQYSDNGKVWSAAEENVSGLTARYIRLINTSDSEKKVTVSRLSVSLDTVGDMGELVSSDIPVNADWGDTRNNGKAFDGNMSTQTKFGGSAIQGNTAVYSFGQEIDIHSIRIYTADNTQDYIRDAKVQLSTDGKKWVDAFEIGDGQLDTEEQANQNMSAAGAGEADSNYPNIRYYGKDDLDTTARYMRLYVTADFPNRSVIINEIVLNGGAYISAENNMALSGTIEEKGHQPNNMLDGDFGTTYRPSEKNGSMTYKIADSEGIRSFRVIQSGEASGAAVTVQLYNEEKGSVETQKVGTLVQAVNEFAVKDGYSLLDITFDWEEKIPDIAEILLLEQKAEVTDKEKLNALLEKKPDAYDMWTVSSQKAYDAVVEMARAVVSGENVTQTMVDNAVLSLEKTEANAEIRANEEMVSALQDLVSGKADNSSRIYTTVSYAAYINMITKAGEALKNPADLSQTRADQLKTDTETAKAGLAYSNVNREQAELEGLRYDAISEENYTAQSYQDMADAKAAIDTLIEQDKAAEAGGGERVDPQQFIDVRTAFVNAVNNLVDVTVLKAAIAQEETITDPSVYTADSYQAFAAAVEAGKKLLQNGTADDIAAAAADINTAFNALETDPKALVESMIKEARSILEAEGAADRYTEDSYKTLEETAAEAELHKTEIGYVEKIRTAIEGLVNVEQLRTQIEAAKAVDAEKYTISSYKTVFDVLEQINNEEILKSGSREDVEAAVKAASNAILALVPRAQGAEDYRSSITLKPEKGYTADSYKAYKEAYEALVAIDPSDLSAEEFARLKAAFENAELGLQIADSGSGGQAGNGQNDGKDQTGNGQNGEKDRTGKPQTSGKDSTAVQTGDNTNIVPVVIVLVLCLAAVAAVVVMRNRRK